MIADYLSIPVTVVGMALLTLVAAGLLSTYQRGQAYKRLRLQGLLQGARHMETLLTQMAGASLPRDVRVMLRQEIRDRYRLIARIHPRFPQVQRLITEAEQKRGAEGSDVGQALPVPDSQATFDQWQAGFRELLAILQAGALLKPPAPDLAARYRRQLLEREAECLFGHFMNQADKFKGEGRASVARTQVQQLTEWLRSLPTKTERTQDLLAQAEEAYQYLLKGKIPADAAAAGA